jgi:hypothetical protein
MIVRLGDLLVKRGVLTDGQREQILDAQGVRARPFGVLAEELFGVSPLSVEDAWAEQYAQIALRVDPRSVEVDPGVARLISARQAWQFGIIPVRWVGRELQVVSAIECLARAMRFAGWRVAAPCTFAICDRAALVQGLSIHYAMPGMDAAFVTEVLGYAKAG